MSIWLILSLNIDQNLHNYIKQKHVWTEIFTFVSKLTKLLQLYQNLHTCNKFYTNWQGYFFAQNVDKNLYNCRKICTIGPKFIQLDKIWHTCTNWEKIKIYIIIKKTLHALIKICTLTQKINKISPIVPKFSYLQ